MTEAAKESGIFPSVTFEQRKTKSKLATTVLHFPIGVCEAAAEASKAAVAEQNGEAVSQFSCLSLSVSAPSSCFIPFFLFVCYCICIDSWLFARFKFDNSPRHSALAAVRCDAM